MIRLSKIGRKGEARFRIVVIEKRERRDGKPVEDLGWYQKNISSHNKDINIKRYKYWLEKGATPSPTVAKLLSN